MKGPRVTLIALFILGAELQADPLVNITYEDGSENSGYTAVGQWTNWDPNQVVYDHRRSIDSVEVRTGNHAIRHEERRNDPLEAYAPRTESDNIAMGETDIYDGQTWYYGFSIYFPSNWEFDGIYDDIVFQWKGREAHPFMFITQKHDQLFIRINGDFTTRGLQYQITPPGQAMALGTWHDIRVKVVWEAGNNLRGRVELDHKLRDEANYRRAFNYHGPNMYHTTGYLKWGIYKPDMGRSPIASRSIWHDNIRIGSDWESVDPSVN